MQQFTVPQFIDVEDKIIGPITSRQFLILTTGFIVSGIFYKIFDFSAFATFSLSVFAVSGVFAFFKINGMPFHFFILNFLQTLKRPGLRVWDKSFGKEVEVVLEEIEHHTETFIPKKHFTSSRLNELSLMVDTQGAYKGEGKRGGEIKTI